MQFNFISLGALAMLVTAVVGKVHLGGERRTLADDCKRSFTANPSIGAQTTLLDPQPTKAGTGSGGFGNTNGTTPTYPPAMAANTGTTTSSNVAGAMQVEWTMGVLAAAGVVAMAV